jgi:hypothetical protein
MAMANVGLYFKNIDLLEIFNFRKTPVYVRLGKALTTEITDSLKFSILMIHH